MEEGASSCVGGGVVMESRPEGIFAWKEAREDFARGVRWGSMLLVSLASENKTSNVSSHQGD